MAVPDARRQADGSQKGPVAPSSFYCPISMELMNDPVMVATGHTYDRVCIERWLQQGNRTCPVTGMRLRHLELTPNFALRNAIQVLQGYFCELVLSAQGQGIHWRDHCVCKPLTLMLVEQL